MKKYIDAKSVRQYVIILLSVFMVTVMPTNVFAFDTATPVTRVSTTTSGAESIGGASVAVSISADGRYVAFRSDATNLVPGDTNGASDVFVKDTVTGTVVCASTDSGQVLGNGSSTGPIISADGRHVVFSSSSTNLVANDTNALNDAFVKDLVTNETTRVSTDSAGAQGNGTSSGSIAISADGRYVAFTSAATNLVANDTNAVRDAFVKDLVTNETTRVSTDSAGAQGNGAASTLAIAISADGRYVAFTSAATNLVANDTNALNDAFVKDLVTNETTRVSTDSAGAQGNGAVTIVGGGGTAISGNGRYVAFVTAATNMITDDVNGVLDVFIKDLVTGMTTLASSNSSGVQGNGATASQPPILTHDGRYIVFASDATNLVPGDTNGVGDTFIKDTTSGTVARFSTDSSGAQINTATGGYSLSSNGKYVTFTSAVATLVPNDANGFTDVFYRISPFWVEPPVISPSTPFVPGAPNTGVPPAQTNYLYIGIFFIIVIGLGSQGIRFVRKRL